VSQRSAYNKSAYDKIVSGELRDPYWIVVAVAEPVDGESRRSGGRQRDIDHSSSKRFVSFRSNTKRARGFALPAIGLAPRLC
jgi:hypothetical protein